MNVLEMNHVKKHFGGLEVLKDINLSVSEGQVVSIIGPSGSGKSTLLRCATLLETMDNGDLIYLGNYAAKNSENGLKRLFFIFKENFIIISFFFAFLI